MTARLAITIGLFLAVQPALAAGADQPCGFADWRDADVASLERCAGADVPEAAFWLARRLESGNVVAENPARAATLYRRALVQGMAEAGLRLGMLFERGQGVAADPVRAADLYLAAAEAGVIEAQYRYARLHDDARGALKNRTLAAAWYLKAAMQGHAPAQYRLGLLHARGDGVERDMVETFAWWKIASVNGHIRARRGLKDLGDHLGLPEFAAARRLIHEREATAVVYR